MFSDTVLGGLFDIEVSGGERVDVLLVVAELTCLASLSMAVDSACFPP